MKTKITTFSIAILLTFNCCNSNHNKVATKKQDTVVEPRETPVTHLVEDTPFLMPVDSTFTITGRGTVATGRIARGTIHIGNAVEIIGLLPGSIYSVVTDVAISFKNVGKGITGDSVELLLRGVDRRDIRRGMVICAPHSISAHIQFICKVHLLSKEEGGRPTSVLNKFKPHFLILTADVMGEVEVPSRIEIVTPGDSVNMTVRLSSPVALEKNFGITIHEGRDTIGSGLVTEILK
jgi:elongation factor Tu